MGSLLPGQSRRIYKSSSVSDFICLSSQFTRALVDFLSPGALNVIPTSIQRLIMSATTSTGAAASGTSKTHSRIMIGLTSAQVVMTASPAFHVSATSHARPKPQRQMWLCESVVAQRVVVCAQRKPHSAITLSALSWRKLGRPRLSAMSPSTQRNL